MRWELYAAISVIKIQKKSIDPFPNSCVKPYWLMVKTIWKSRLLKVKGWWSQPFFGPRHTNHLSAKAMEGRVKAMKRTTISKKKKQPAASPMEIPWKSHGNPMEIPWKSHGNPMEIARNTYLYLWIIQWNTYLYLWKWNSIDLSYLNGNEMPWKTEFLIYALIHLPSVKCLSGSFN